MGIYGGEGSPVNQEFMDAYTKIAGQGRPAAEQIKEFQGRVDKTLVNAQEQIDPDGKRAEKAKLEGRRELTGANKVGADIYKAVEPILTGGGDLFFGKDTGDDNPLEFAGRTIANIPGGMIGGTIQSLASVPGIGAATDYKYYDPETSTVPEGELGTFTPFGQLTRGASVGIDLGSMGLGATRGLVGLGKGVARGASKGLSKAIGNGIKEEGDTFGQAVRKGFTEGLDNPLKREPRTELGKKAQGLRQGWEDFGSKNIGTRVLTTGIEEAGEEAAQTTLDWNAENDERVLRGEITNEEWGSLGENVAMSALGGGIAGGVIGLGGGLVNKFAKAPEEKSELSQALDTNNGQKASNAFEDVVGYNVASEEAIKAYNDETTSDKVAGQSTIVNASSDVKINSYEAGRNTIAATYATTEGKEDIDEQLGEAAAELGIDIQEALLAPETYTSKQTGKTGEEAAIEDFNKVLDKNGGMDALLWKDPANGYQLKLTLTRLVTGNLLNVNQAIAKLFNGDYDADKLGHTFGKKAIGQAGYATQYLSSNAVKGKVEVDLDYTKFKYYDDVKIDEAELLNAIVASYPDGDRIQANKQLKAMKAASSAARKRTQKEGEKIAREANAQAIAEFLSMAAVNIDPRVAENLLDAMMMKGETIEAVTKSTVTAATNEMKEAEQFILNPSGKVAGDTSPREMGVRTGTITTIDSENSLREAAIYMFRTAIEKGITSLNPTALIQFSMHYQNVLELGQKPQEILKKAYRQIVLKVLKDKMKKLDGGKFRTEENFGIFIETVNELRSAFEASTQYFQVDGNWHTFDGFVGITGEIEATEGAIKAFHQICGGLPFDDFFEVEPTSVYKDKTVDYVFKEMATSRLGESTAFSKLTDPKYELRWVMGVKAMYKTSAKNLYDKIVEIFTKATSRELSFDPKTGVVAMEDMAAFNNRFSALLAVIRDRIVNLGIYDINSITKYPGFYEALTTRDPQVLIDVACAFTCIDECRPIVLAAKMYNKKKTLQSRKAVEAEAYRLMNMMSPPFQMIGAQILDCVKDDVPLESSIYNVLSTLHEYKGAASGQIDRVFQDIYSKSEFDGSYGNLYVDLLVTADSEMKMGQFNDNIARAKRYSTMAEMDDQQYAEKLFSDIFDAENIRDGNYLSVISVIEEMSKEPILWDDDVVSEFMRSSGTMTNDSKEKAKASIFAKIVHGGIAEKEGGYKTQEEIMFLEETFKVKDESFFANREVLHALIFGTDENVSVEVVDKDNRTQIITKRIFFEWATGEKYDSDPSARKNQQYRIIKAKKQLLPMLAPHRLTTSVAGSVELKMEAYPETYYQHLKRTSPEKRKEELTLSRIKAKMQGDVSAIAVIMDHMEYLNEGRTLPFTKPIQFKRLYVEAVNNISRALYHNATIKFGEMSGFDAATLAKAQSKAKAYADLHKLLARLQVSRLEQEDGQNMLSSIITQSVESDFMHAAGSRILGMTSGIFDDQFSLMVNLAEKTKDINIQAAITMLKVQARIISVMEFNKNADLSFTTTVNKMRSAISALTDEQLDKLDPNKLYASAADHRADLFKKINGYTKKDHEALIKEQEVFNEEAINFDKLPDTIEEFSALTEKQQIEFFEKINPDVVVDGDHQVPMYKVLLDLMAKARDTVTTHNANVKSINGIFNKRQAALKRSYRRDVKAGVDDYDQLVIDLNKLGAEVKTDLSIENAKAKSSIQDIRDEYTALVEDRERYRFSSLMRSLEQMGDPLNHQVFSDLESINDDFISMSQRYAEELELTGLANLDTPINDATAGQIYIPQLSTIDPTTKSAIRAAQSDLAAGDVEIGTAMAAGGTGRRSRYAEIGAYQSCKHPGTKMSVREAVLDPTVVSFRMEDQDGKETLVRRRSWTDHYQTRLYYVTKDFEVTAYKEGECSCKGLCNNHNTRPVFNRKSNNNLAATFFRALSYFMEEVSQLQKKKALTGTSKPLILKPLHKDDLSPKEIMSNDIKFIMSECQAYRDKLVDLYKTTIDEIINNGEDNPQKKLIDEEDFPEDMADFNTRFVQLNAYLDDGSVMSEYQLKNIGLEERILKLGEMAGVQNVTVTILTVAPEQSELSSIAIDRAEKDKKKTRSQSYIIGTFQDEGAKITQDAEGRLGYTKSAGFKPGQLNLDNTMSQTTVPRTGMSELPPGPDQVNAWMQFQKMINGEYEFTSEKPSRAGVVDLQFPVMVNSQSEAMLDEVGGMITGQDRFFLINIDMGKEHEFKSGASQIISKLFRPKQEGSNDNIEFGLHAQFIKAPQGKTPMVYLANPDAKTLKAYCDRYEMGTQNVAIVVPNSARKQIDQLESYEASRVDSNGNRIIMIRPADKMKNQLNGGFQSQVREAEGGFRIIVESTREGIADGFLLLPRSMLGEDFYPIAKGSVPIKELMQGRVGQATIVPDEERHLVGEALRGEHPNALIKIPPSWEHQSDDAKAMALKQYEKAQLNNEDIAQGLTSSHDIICVIKLPPMEGDLTKTSMYYPITMSDSSLGSSADKIDINLSTDGNGFTFYGLSHKTWTEDESRKFVGEDVAFKAMAKISSDELVRNSEGIECCEAKSSDLTKKKMQATVSKLKKLINAFQLERKIGSREYGWSMWFDPSTTAEYEVPTYINPLLTQDDRFLGAASDYQSTYLQDKMLDENISYKKPGDPGFDEKAELALRQFLLNCRFLKGHPNKLLSPMVVEDGKLVHKTFDDKIMNVYFNKMDDQDVFLVLNYISGGKFCPANTTDMKNDYFIRYDYKMKMSYNDEDGNPAYRFFEVVDKKFNAEYIASTDGTTDRVREGLQQSARKIAYTHPAAGDRKAVRKKQNLDARQYEDLQTTDAAIWKKLKLASKQATPPSSREQQNFKRIAELINGSVGLVSSNNNVANLNKAFEDIEAAYFSPAGIHVLGQDGKQKQIEPNEENGITEEWKAIRREFEEITGLNDENRWTDQEILRHISNLLTFTAQENGFSSFSDTEVREMLKNYKEELNKKGQFPRKSEMSQSGEPGTVRMGSCGSYASLRKEWELPKVRESFGTFDEFLDAAGEFQRSQAENYHVILGGSEQKILMYRYLQLYLQFNLNSRIKDGVGEDDFNDYDNRGDEAVNAFLRMLGMEPSDAAVQEAMKTIAVNNYKRTMAQDELDSGGRAVRGRQKKDKDGNKIPRRFGRTTNKTTLGNMFNALYSLRVGNALFLNASLAGANVLQTVVNGRTQKMANRINFLSGGLFTNGIGVQPRDINMISDAASDSLMKEFFRLEGMTAFYNDPSLLDGFFADPDAVVARLNESMKQGNMVQRGIRKYARFSANMATGFGVFNKPMIEHFLFRFNQYVGDTKWLSEHMFNPETGEHLNITEPIMTQEEVEFYLSNENNLHDFMAKVSDPKNQWNVIYRAALEDALRITWANKNLVTELLRSIIMSVGTKRDAPVSPDTAQGVIALLVSPFLKYTMNFSMNAMLSAGGIPCQTIMHILHHKGLDAKQWLQANGVKNGVIERIDFEAMSSSRSIQEALLRDALRFGGVWFLGLVTAGLLDFQEPEDDDLKGFASEYGIGIIRNAEGEPMRLELKWPLQDILGAFWPVAVYMSTVLKGHPRPEILANGMADLLTNNVTLSLANVSEFLGDPLMWQREAGDEDLAMMNGLNVQENDAAINSGNQFYMSGLLALYKTFIPNSIDRMLGGIPGSEKEVTSNYIYEVDDSGKPTERVNPETGGFYLERTSDEDAAWRRMSKKYPIMGMFLNMQSGIVAKGGTGYMPGDMPLKNRYNPIQMASNELYKLNGDVEHDDAIAADIITLLYSYDNLDELMATGFHIDSDTRFYVGQKVWDEYYSYDEQIKEAKAEGLNDFNALGNGDHMLGSQIYNTWLNSMEAQKAFYKDFYYKKVNSEQLRTRVETANVMKQGYRKDANGEWYGTGVRNDNPLAFVAFGARSGNAGSAGNWESIDPLTKLPIGERGWIWNTANSYYDAIDFEKLATNGDGKGYSKVHIEGQAGDLADISTLKAMFNPAAANSGSSYSRRSSGGGGGGGGGSSMPNLYSNPQDLNGDRPTLARMDRLYDSQFDYIRPDWETKGSNKASRRSDI